MVATRIMVLEILKLVPGSTAIGLTVVGMLAKTTDILLFRIMVGALVTTLMALPERLTQELLIISVTKEQLDKVDPGQTQSIKTLDMLPEKLILDLSILVATLTTVQETLNLVLGDMVINLIPVVMLVMHTNSSLCKTTAGVNATTLMLVHPKYTREDQIVNATKVVLDKETVGEMPSMLIRNIELEKLILV